MSVTLSDDGEKVLVSCHRGCTFDEIVSAMSLDARDFFTNNTETTTGQRSSAKHEPKAAERYEYQRADGSVALVVERYGEKEFKQGRPSPNGGGEIVWNLKGLPRSDRRLPFKLPELLAREGGSILIPEGEKDVLTAGALGLVATCNAGGAGKWKPEHTEHLPAKRRIVICPDEDAPGLKHADQIAASCRSAGFDVFLVRPGFGLGEGADLSDWVTQEREHGCDVDQIRDALRKMMQPYPTNGLAAGHDAGPETPSEAEAAVRAWLDADDRVRPNVRGILADLAILDDLTYAECRRAVALVPHSSHRLYDYAIRGPFLTCRKGPFPTCHYHRDRWRARPPVSVGPEGTLAGSPLKRM